MSKRKPLPQRAHCLVCEIGEAIQRWPEFDEREILAALVDIMAGLIVSTSAAENLTANATFVTAELGKAIVAQRDSRAMDAKTPHEAGHA